MLLPCTNVAYQCVDSYVATILSLTFEKIHRDYTVAVLNIRDPKYIFPRSRWHDDLHHSCCCDIFNVTIAWPYCIVGPDGRQRITCDGHSTPRERLRRTKSHWTQLKATSGSPLDQLSSRVTHCHNTVAEFGWRQNRGYPLICFLPSWSSWQKHSRGWLFHISCFEMVVLFIFSQRSTSDYTMQCTAFRQAYVKWKQDSSTRLDQRHRTGHARKQFHTMSMTGCVHNPQAPIRGGLRPKQIISISARIINVLVPNERIGRHRRLVRLHYKSIHTTRYFPSLCTNNSNY